MNSQGRDDDEAQAPVAMSGCVAEALTFANITQVDMARHITESLQRGIDRAAVNELVSGKRHLAADDMFEIARLTGFALPQIQ
jgi:hypothetical protein